jgi:hypothetical protein
MHLSHPSLPLVKSLDHSQRVERRRQANNPNPAGGQAQPAAGGTLGWVPPGHSSGADAGGWQPPAGGDEGVFEGDSWKPSY